MSDEFYLSQEWLALRYQALKRYGGMCQCCGATAQIDNPLHVDHIKPRSRFPELALDITNLQVLCMNCNRGKGASDITNWRSARKPFVSRTNSKWTAYKKALACCEYIRDNGLADEDKWYIRYVMLPLIGMMRDKNDHNRITEIEAKECFMEAVSGGWHYGTTERSGCYFEAQWNSYRSVRGCTNSIGTLIWACKNAGMKLPWLEEVLWENDYLRMKKELEQSRIRHSEQIGTSLFD
jgi:HNH endonuclease